MELSEVNKLFAAYQSRVVQKRPVGTQIDKKNKLALMIQNGNFLCLYCSRASLASQHDVFVSRDSSAAKGSKLPPLFCFAETQLWFSTT